MRGICLISGKYGRAAIGRGLPLLAVQMDRLSKFVALTREAYHQDPATMHDVGSRI